jgi:hypothetical protein
VQIEEPGRHVPDRADTHIKLSPVPQADRINEPLLLIHGELAPWNGGWSRPREDALRTCWKHEDHD